MHADYFWVPGPNLQPARKLALVKANWPYWNRTVQQARERGSAPARHILTRGAQSGRVDTGEIGVSRSAVSLTSHVPWPCASRPIAITQQAARTADSAARGAARSERAETHSTIRIRPDWADDSARCGRLAAGSHVACGAVWCVCTACRRGALRR